MNGDRGALAMASVWVGWTEDADGADDAKKRGTQIGLSLCSSKGNRTIVVLSNSIEPSDER